MVIIDQEQENFVRIKLQETWEIVSKKHDPYYSSTDALNFQTILLFP